MTVSPQVGVLFIPVYRAICVLRGADDPVAITNPVSSSIGSCIGSLPSDQPRDKNTVRRKRL